MAKSNRFSTSADRKLMYGVGTLAVLAIPLTLFTAMQQSTYQNEAAGLQPTLPVQAITNLNNTTESLTGINTDGTMGPKTAYGNWSTSLPNFLKGHLVFAVTDPVQPPSPTNVTGSDNQPTGKMHMHPTHTMPTQAQGQNDGSGHIHVANGPQSVTALNVTVSKVEVHIAYLGNAHPNPSNSPVQETPAVSPVQSGPVSHWETLQIATPVTFNLVAFANNSSSEDLGLSTLAAGLYTEIRLYIQSATATFADGTTQDLTILGRDNTVRIVKPFTVVAGQTTKLTMDFDAQHSVVKAGGQYLLRPVVAQLLQDNHQQ